MGTVLLTPMQAAFVAWNRLRGAVRRFGDAQPSPQETFEAGYRAGLLDHGPKLAAARKRTGQTWGEQCAGVPARKPKKKKSGNVEGSSK